jgi:dTDP-4-dehydrorhamnose reductase
MSSTAAAVPRQETDADGPLSVYGRTKLEGEQRIQASGCRHLIFRTSWVYAARGGNFAKTMLRLAQERERSRDRRPVGRPTGADLIADVTAHAMRQVALPTGWRPVPSGGAGRNQLACLCQPCDGAPSKCSLRWRSRPGKFARAHQRLSDAGPRPLNSRLDTQKLQATFGLQLPHGSRA